MMGSFGGVNHMGYVPSCDEDPIKVVSWLVMARIDWTEDEKMAV